MTSIEFVKRRIDKLVSVFSDIKCRYEFDQYSNTHLIEILPNSVYKINTDYHQFETSIIDEFIELYPYESICFITDDSMLKIENAIYESKGLTYDLFTHFIDEDMISLNWITKFSFKVPQNISFFGGPENRSQHTFKINLFEGSDLNFNENEKPFPFYSVLPQFNYDILEKEMKASDKELQDYDDSYSLAA
jgi:hypothetical protein